MNKSLAKKTFLAMFLTGLVFSAPVAHSKSVIDGYTEEQLEKARAVASNRKYPINFDEMVKEADRLGAECNGDLTNISRILICRESVEIAQTQEEIKASRKRQAQLDDITANAIMDAANEARKQLNRQKSN